MTRTECEELYTKNQFLVEFVLNKYFYMSRYDEDLQQEGRIGLWEACRVYNPNKGKFSTIACKYIFNNIGKQIRYNARKKRFNENDVSLDAAINSNPNYTLLAINTSGCKSNIELDRYVDILDFVNSLSKCDRQIVQLHVSGYNQTEIAERLHTTQASISKHIAAMRKNYYNSKWRSKKK